MSLINDALKRATQSPTSSPTAPVPEPKTPMQPVDYQSHGRGLPRYFFPTLLLILVGACWFLVKGIQSGRQPSGTLVVQAREPEPVAAQPVDTAFAAAAPLPPDTSAAPSAIPNRTFSLEDDSPASAAPERATPTASPSADASKSIIKLQGIFFRLTNPSAMVNGKNVIVGTRINGATVTAITRDSVSFEADGQTTVLTLE